MPNNGIPKNWPCDVVEGVILTDMGQLKSNTEKSGISGNKFGVKVRGLKIHSDRHSPPERFNTGEKRKFRQSKLD
jgi:hypothetical protein